MRLSDITAGVRAVGMAHCYIRAAMHRPAKCRYEPCDQKIGKQRGNGRGNERGINLFRRRASRGTQKRDDNVRK